MTGKKELQNIFLETCDFLKNTNHYFENLESMVRWTKFYKKTPHLDTSEYQDYQTKITVENKDTFDKVKEQTNPKKWAVLNMASFKFPGGGVLGGSRSQEEELCRRSTLIKSLYQFQDNEDLLDLVGLSECTKKIYPLPMYSGIYSPGVEIFRNSVSYSILDTPIQTNIISVSALSHPQIDSQTGMMTSKDTTIMKGKIRAIFRIALLNHKENLVLGAFGCGAYGCPPKQVAELFKSILQEKEFSCKFKEICFAIIEDKNSKGKNYKTFKNILQS